MSLQRVDFRKVSSGVGMYIRQGWRTHLHVRMGVVVDVDIRVGIGEGWVWVCLWAWVWEFACCNQNAYRNSVRTPEMCIAALLLFENVRNSITTWLTDRYLCANRTLLLTSYLSPPNHDLMLCVVMLWPWVTHV